MLLVRIALQVLLLPLLVLVFAIAWLSEAVADLGAGARPALGTIRLGQPAGSHRRRRYPEGRLRE